MKEYKRILIIEVNWLGDVLFSTPFIRAVRQCFKDAYIACMVVPRCKDILEHNPRINEIIVYDEKGAHRTLPGKISLISFLRKKKFDCAIILHRSLTRTLLATFAGIPERVGYITEKRRFFLTRPVESSDEPLHKVEYFLKIAESLGCDTTNKDYEFFVTNEERGQVEAELIKCGVTKDDRLVVIHPGGNWPPKRWSEENFARFSDGIAKKYNVKIVASGARRDEGIALRIKEKMKEDLIIFSGKTNLPELGALMERADFVISGDSGPMHIAVAMKSNVLALFGPTSPVLTGPYGSENFRVIQKNTECDIPCYDLTCDNYRCMEAITVEDALCAFDEMYSKSAKQCQK